jgi:hypothetical protein
VYRIEVCFEYGNAHRSNEERPGISALWDIPEEKPLWRNRPRPWAGSKIDFGRFGRDGRVRREEKWAGVG